MHFRSVSAPTPILTALEKLVKAIVTGHSRGLGEALAIGLLERGLEVLGVSRHSHAEMAARFPRFSESRVDLADVAAVCRFIESPIFQAFGNAREPVILINNAAMLQPVGRSGSLAAAEIQQAVNVNVLGPLLLTNAVLQCAAPDLSRRILHISSGAARTAYSGWSIYGATKAALDHHARCVSEEGRAHVRICSVAPGVLDTRMQADVRQLETRQFPARERFISLKDSGQLVPPAEAAAKLLAFLFAPAFGDTPTADVRTF